MAYSSVSFKIYVVYALLFHMYNCTCEYRLSMINSLHATSVHLIK